MRSEGHKRSPNKLEGDELPAMLDEDDDQTQGNCRTIIF